MGRVDALAADGLVRRTDLRGAGIPNRTIDRRVSSGIWERIFPEIYALKLDPPSDSRKRFLRAATLWLGTCSAASHRSALELWGIAGPNDIPDCPEVTSTHGISRENVY